MKKIQNFYKSLAIPTITISIYAYRLLLIIYGKHMKNNKNYLPYILLLLITWREIEQIPLFVMNYINFEPLWMGNNILMMSAFGTLFALLVLASSIKKHMVLLWVTTVLDTLGVLKQCYNAYLHYHYRPTYLPGNIENILVIVLTMCYILYVIKNPPKTDNK